MKSNLLRNAILLILATALAIPAFGHEKKGRKPGPNGGRVIEAVEPHLEFHVTKDRKVQITALSKDLKPTKLSGQVIAITAGERSKPTKLALQDEGGKLISSNALPSGNDFPISISIRANANAKAVYEKFNLNLEECPTCEYAEYACTCTLETEGKK